MVEEDKLKWCEPQLEQQKDGCQAIPIKLEGASWGQRSTMCW